MIRYNGRRAGITRHDDASALMETGLDQVGRLPCRKTCSQGTVGVGIPGTLRRPPGGLRPPTTRDVLVAMNPAGWKANANGHRRRPRSSCGDTHQFANHSPAWPPPSWGTTSPPDHLGQRGATAWGSTPSRSSRPNMLPGHLLRLFDRPEDHPAAIRNPRRSRGQANKLTIDGVKTVQAEDEIAGIAAPSPAPMPGTLRRDDHLRARACRSRARLGWP